MRRLFRALFTALKKLFTWRPFQIGLALLLTGWLVYRNYRPLIHKVPVVVSGAEVTIIGEGFGRRQGNSYLLFRSENEEKKIAETLSWSDGEIMVSNPGTGGNGYLQVMKKIPATHWASNAVYFVVQATGLPTDPYGYEVPIQEASPWPLFRHDHRNTGRSPLQANYQGDRPWSFVTGKGIFSTPIIDHKGTIYIGSADHIFYALNPDGTEKWRYRTGEIIDSAGALPRPDPENGEETVIFISGDGLMYHLRTAEGAANAPDRVLWTFDAAQTSNSGFNNWWEGNVAIGYDGTIYAGNTNFNYYAVNPNGKLEWTYTTASNNWSIAGFGDDGTIFWGSNDTLVHAVSADGQPQWTKRTLGFIAASAAIGTDGTVFIGSFDSYLYALAPQTGRVKWKFKTNEHIYSSAALGVDENGNTNALYFGSADGIFYALNTEGELLWTYDTGDPIRSSPALGLGPEGEGKIVYFGSGNGKLYALNAENGRRRWSFDTTPDNPELYDRNDLNGSPALGEHGVYIGGEHGYVWYVPYDYCLHNTDARCRTEPGSDLPANTAELFYVTPGGSTLMEDPATLPAATLITQRLVVREDGQTVDARVCNNPIYCAPNALRVEVEPDFPFQVEPSADGHYLHIIPDAFLDPATTYKIDIEGNYYTGGWYLGNLTLGGNKRGRFQDTFTFLTQPAAAPQPPLAVSENEVTALEWTRLAVPLPSMLPSLNQIGFDYMDWILGTIEISDPDEEGKGKFILWAIGGHVDENGRLVAEPNSDFTLPLNGVYQGDAFILSNQDFNMAITGIDIPFNLFQLRGRFGNNLVVEPGATAYADTEALSIPNFGPYLVVGGLANNWIEKLLPVGTYITRPYGEAGGVNQRPSGIAVTSVDYTPATRTQDGRVVATLQLAAGASYPLSHHRPAILLLDAAQTAAVSLDYHTNLSSTADANGNLATITLTIPAGTEMPSTLEAVVILDVFPLHRQIITEK